MSFQINKFKLNNAPNDVILKKLKWHRLKDLIHREKGLELHTKPNHKNNSQLDM